MNDLPFLNNEARIASAFAPKDYEISVIASRTKGRFDVRVGSGLVATYLTRSEALACIMGAGGAFTAVAH